jgi:hypothetical protein
MRDDPAEASPAGGATALRCSSFARSEDLDPVGSAGSYRGIVLAEIPRPWPRDIAEHAALAGAAEALRAANMRLQGLVPDDRSDPHRRQLMAFTSPPGAFDRYRGRGWTAADSLLGEAVTAIAASGGDDAGPALAQPGAVVGSDGAGMGRHVLVCTHGRRDACCGTLGTRLASALPELGAGVRVWRTSHTGGHRFAPTALLLAEGTMWAYLDIDRLVGVSERTSPSTKPLPSTAAARASTVRRSRRRSARPCGPSAGRGSTTGGGARWWNRPEGGPWSASTPRPPTADA